MVRAPPADHAHPHGNVALRMSEDRAQPHRSGGGLRPARDPGSSKAFRTGTVPPHPRSAHPHSAHPHSAHAFFGERDAADLGAAHLPSARAAGEKGQTTGLRRSRVASDSCSNEADFDKIKTVPTNAMPWDGQRHPPRCATATHPPSQPLLHLWWAMGKLTVRALRAVLGVVLAGTVFVQALMVWALATDPEDGSLPLTPCA